MFGIILIFIIALLLVVIPISVIEQTKPEEEHSERYTAQMDKLWSVAQSSMRERKPLRAEKALLTILKFDEKNAAAYNRLGILYAKSQKFDEAIECFEIAQSLDNNPSSLHNAGLIYLETGAYEKAAMAFRQAAELEGDVPARYIALAKAEEKLGHKKSALESLEAAYAIDRSTTTLRQILALHETSGDTEAIAKTTERIEHQIAENAQKVQKTVKRPLVKPHVAKRPIAKATRPTKPAARTRVVTKRPAPKPKV